MSRDQLLDVVEKCYAASLNGQQWSAALDAIADFTGGVDTTLEMRHDIKETPNLFLCGTRLPDDGVHDYLEHFAAVCPRIPYINTLRRGRVGCDYDFLSEPEMDRDEFYADFLRPQKMRYFLAGSLNDSAGRSNSIVSVQRSTRQGHASAEDIARLRLLLPHVGQALDTFLRLRADRAQDRLLIDAVECMSSGVILIGATGQVLHANQAALSMASDGDGLAIGRQRLNLASRSANKAYGEILTQLLSGTLASRTHPGGEFYASRPSGRAPYAIRVRRLPAAQEVDLRTEQASAIVLIDDLAAAATPAAHRISAAFGLTQRQAELAAALYAGRSLREHAKERGIAFSTARYHLYQLLSRLGLQSQTDLIRLIGRMPPAP